MGQWLNWLPRINSSGGRANSFFFFFFFFFDTRAKILGEEGGGGGWSDFHVNGSWYRRLYGKERGYGLYSIENTRGKSIVASARFVDPWACAPCAAYIGIRDGWIHPLRRKWRCTMMGDVFYDRVYLFKVFCFFFLGRKGRVVIQQRIFLYSVLKYDEQQFLNNFSTYALSLRCFRDIGEKIAATFLR